MQISTNGSWSGIAVALVIVLAPLSASAQRAAERTVEPAAPAADAAPAAAPAPATDAAAPPADAAPPPADPAAPPPFLQEVLKDLVPAAPRGRPPAVGLGPAKSINDAIAALNAEMYAEARAALAEVRRDRLSPYELGVVEVTLFYIALGEDKLDEARQHLQNALDSGGLSADEVAATQRNLERINARLAQDPRTT